MLTFDPPELELRLKNALTGFAKALDFELSDLQGDFFDPTQEDYDPNDFEDQVITPNTKCQIGLPRVSADYELNYEQLIDILLEAQGARLSENTEVWSPKNRYLLRVTAEYAEVVSLIDRHFYYAEKVGSSRILEHTEAIDGGEFVCCLARGFTLFGILITSKGDWDKYFPPIIEEECFVEIRFPVGTSELMVRNISEAYMFELSTSHKINLTKFPRPTFEEYWHCDDDENETTPEPLRLRPLLVGKGMHGIIELFNKARSSVKVDISLLFYVKVIEYASPTILRQKLTTTIQNKLSSPRAMNPDASFILELDRLFQENRTFKKDKEAIALTIEQCCDIDELKRVAPPFLKRLATVSDSSAKQDRDLAAREFAYALSSTRNSIAHAKANYEPTGEECPETQLLQFVECAEIAAQHVIRWFARSPEHARVL